MLAGPSSWYKASTVMSVIAGEEELTLTTPALPSAPKAVADVAMAPELIPPASVVASCPEPAMVLQGFIPRAFVSV